MPKMKNKGKRNKIYYGLKFIHCYLIIINKMNTDNQFANIDYLAQDAKISVQPRKLRNSKSKLQHITKKACILPSIRSTSSFRRSNLSTKESSLGRATPRDQIDDHSTQTYRHYLEEAKYKERYNQLNSLPITPLSFFHKRKPSPLGEIKEYPEEYQKSRKMQMQLQKDKSKYPIKYKIICQQLGYDESRVLAMQESEVKQLQSDYIKKTGKQYLKQSRANIKPTHSKTQSSDSLCKATPKHDKNYVHEIFKKEVEAAQSRAKAKSLLQKQKSQKAIQQKQLNYYEDALGNYVYKRVAKHLCAAQKHRLDYCQELNGEEKVDEALIKFLKFKIKRISTVEH